MHNPKAITTLLATNPEAWSPNRLMTARQGSLLLRSFVAISFCTNGPTGYDHQGRTLYSPLQLLKWLRQLATVMSDLVDLTAAVQASQESKRIEGRSDDQVDDDSDGDYAGEGEDDFDDDEDDVGQSPEI